MKVGLPLASAALALAAMANASQAAILGLGTTVAATQVGTPTGAVLATTGPISYFGVSADPTVPTPFSGTYTTSVINEGAGNAQGGLTFIYDFTNFGPDAIRVLTATNFTGFTTDVNYDGTGPLPGATAPITFSRSANGSVIGFDFAVGSQLGVPGTPSNPGGSALLIIRTNAQGYRVGGASIIDGGTANVPAFAPTAVPEPATMAAALVGLTVIGGYRLRRRAK